MKTSSSCIGWKTGVFSLIVLTLLFIGAIGCQSDAASDVTGEPQGVEYPIPEGAKTRMTVAFLIKEGQTLWFDVQGRGDIVNLGSPQGYYLPKDIKNHAHYYQLLEQTTQQIEELVTTNGGGRDYNTHLKITLGDYNPDLKATPIIKVEKPTKEEWQVLMQKEEVVREKSSQKTAKVGLRTAMTKGAAQAFFRLFKSISCDRYSGTPCLTFQYAPDGCHARAHYMRKVMAEAGYDCKKIFAIDQGGRLQANTKANCCVSWGVSCSTSSPCGRWLFN
ncbi:MAG: hypothetical protein DLD55_02790 [candidate division SR1 bacterium]|nr:MAG: hypothetical protein DLD55_02790 [candidate division SR1 bacterium]